MKRAYSYKGFEVTVELEALWDSSGTATLKAPSGYVALVRIGLGGTEHPLVAPVRLVDERQRAFATEGEALMAGFSAGQRIVDDTLIHKGE